MNECEDKQDIHCVKEIHSPMEVTDLHLNTCGMLFQLQQAIHLFIFK